MNGKTSEFRDKPACSTKYDLFPVMIICERCGSETETWPDENDTVCSKCGERKRDRRGINMDISIMATIGFTGAAIIGVAILYFIAKKKI